MGTAISYYINSDKGKTNTHTVDNSEFHVLTNIWLATVYAPYISDCFVVY